MKNKQTALEKVINDLEQMKEDGIKFMTIDDFISELYQAKQMEREQIEDAYNAGFEDNTGIHTHDLKWGGKYFTKTYNNGKDS